MAHKVSRRKKEYHNWENGWNVMYDITVVKVVADTYSELISGLDEISDEHLRWWNGSADSLGIEGMPQRIKGKWVATLRTPFVNKRHDDGRPLSDERRRELKKHGLGA